MSDKNGRGGKGGREREGGGKNGRVVYTGTYLLYLSIILISSLSI